MDKILADVRSRYYGNAPGTPAEQVIGPCLTIPFTQFARKYVRPVLRSNHLRIAHAATNTLKSRLIRTKPARQPSDSHGPGVYRVGCAGCDKCYCGETGRCLSVRLREHKNAVRFGNQNNAIFNHVSTHSHPIKWSQSKLVFPSDNYYNRIVIESVLIKETNNFNTKPGVSSVDSLGRDIILQANRHIGNRMT